MTDHTDRVNKALSVLEQNIYRYTDIYPGVDPNSIPAQHARYLTNKGIRAVLTQWLNQDCPREFEESMIALAAAVTA